MGRPDSGVSVTDERDAPREHPRSQKEIKGSDHMIALQYILGLHQVTHYYSHVIGIKLSLFLNFLSS